MKYMKSALVPLFLLIVTASVSASGGDDEKILLQLRLKQGESYVQQTSYTISVVQVIDSDTIHFQEIMHLGTLYDIDSVDSSGTASVIMTLLSFYIKKKDNQHLNYDYEYHSSNEKAPSHPDAVAFYCLLNMPITLRLTKLGELLDVQGIDSLITDIIRVMDEQRKNSILVYDPRRDAWILENTESWEDITAEEMRDWYVADPDDWDIESLDEIEATEVWEVEVEEENEWEDNASFAPSDQETGMEDRLISDLTSELSEWVEGFMIHVLGHANSMYTDIPLGIGDTWTTTHTLNMPVRADFELHWTLKDRSGGNLTIGLQSIVSMDQGVDQKWLYGDSVRFQLSGKQEGTFYVDESTGWTLSGEMTQQFSGHVYMDDPFDLSTQVHPFFVESHVQITTPEPQQPPR